MYQEQSTQTIIFRKIKKHWNQKLKQSQKLKIKISTKNKWMNFFKIIKKK